MRGGCAAPLCICLQVVVNGKAALDMCSLNFLGIAGSGEVRCASWRGVLCKGECALQRGVRNATTLLCEGGECPVLHTAL